LQSYIFIFCLLILRNQIANFEIFRLEKLHFVINCDTEIVE